MSTGNLESKVVAHDFWPSCVNCALFDACQTRPRHPAFPHRWHWGREFAAFADGYLITRSWVGTAAIGRPHTGCPHYQIDPRFTSEPQEHHLLYLKLEHEKTQLETELAMLEGKPKWTKKEKRAYDVLFHSYQRILEQQDALTNAAKMKAQISA